MALFADAYSVCTIEIKRDEDWIDTIRVQRLAQDGSIIDFDLAPSPILDENGAEILDENGDPILDQGASLELFIRPQFDDTILIHKLSSLLSEGGELQVDSAASGINIIVSRANVIANLPIGSWHHFLVATSSIGATEEVWRGPLIVHPGKI